MAQLMTENETPTTYCSTINLNQSPTLNLIRIQTLMESENISISLNFGTRAAEMNIMQAFQKRKTIIN